MKELNTIECASTQDMLIKAAQLLEDGVQTEFLPNCVLKIIE